MKVKAKEWQYRHQPIYSRCCLHNPYSHVMPAGPGHCRGLPFVLFFKTKWMCTVLRFRFLILSFIIYCSGWSWKTHWQEEKGSWDDIVKEIRGVHICPHILITPRLSHQLELCSLLGWGSDTLQKIYIHKHLDLWSAIPNAWTRC